MQSQSGRGPLRIFVTGVKGGLGRALQQVLAEGHELTGGDLPELDITEREQVFEAVEQHRPDIVIHCAAYTDVDGCARNPELVYQVNALGTQNVALACQSFGVAMCHVSTNEVFAGDHPAGYEEWMPLNPTNPYARSKAAAECFVRDILPQHYIVRLAWLFAPGGRNFVHTILRYGRERGRVQVVTDEVGNPTYALDLAAAIGRLVQTGQYGTYHLSNSGACSRWAFANEILRLAGLHEVVNAPILSSDFKRASTPPRFAILHNRAAAALGITMRPWQEALADFMRDYVLEKTESNR